jgi:hypothetical protein
MKGISGRNVEEWYTSKITYNDVLPCERPRIGDSTLHIITTRYIVMRIHRNMGEIRPVDESVLIPVFVLVVPIMLKLV